MELIDKPLFRMDVNEDRIRGYMYDENKNLIKFGTVTDHVFENNPVWVTGKNGIKLMEIPKTDLFANITEATKEEMLQEIDRQIHLRESETESLKKQIAVQTDITLNVFKEILNKEGYVLDTLETEYRILFDKFKQKYMYCENCNKHVEYHTWEDEEYNPKTDDYDYVTYHRCNECGEDE